MKVLLFSDYGGLIPNVLKNKIKGKTFDENRTGEIVDFVERNAIPIELPVCSNLMNWFNFVGHDKIAYICENSTSEEKKFAAISTLNDHPCIVTFTIAEVNPAFEWVLTEYDGAESLMKHENIKRISDKLPIWKFD